MSPLIKSVLCCCFAAFLVAKGFSSETLPAGAPLPQINITSVPPYGSFQDMAGTVLNIDDPQQYHLAIFIHTNGWWTKPTFAQPCTAIANDFSWSADVTTGGSDEFASRYALFLLPINEACPQFAGVPNLPASIFSVAVTHTFIDRGPTSCPSLQFAGQTWGVKTADPAVGPGPNFFACDNAFLDGSGFLHLRINQDALNRWQCAEVVLDRSLGYGRYIFHLRGRIDIIDPNMVIGLFTWDPIAPAANYRELDIEFSRWGNPADPTNAQYVVQPYTDPANIVRFPVTLDSGSSDITVIMDWRPGAATFRSYYGHYLGTPPPANLIHQWTRSGPAVPAPEYESVRINFWLTDGLAPMSGEGDEFIVTDFRHTTNFYPGRALGDFDESACADLGDFLFLLDNWQLDFDGVEVGLPDFLNLLDHWQEGVGCA